MTRTIKASEVKPGMTIRAEYLGVTHELTVKYVETARGLGGAEVRTGLGGSVYLSGRKPVTVLAEPQPEEPTEFGARVVVNGRRFLRASEGGDDYLAWLDSGEGVCCDWEDLCSLGPVQVVPDQGWTVPADTPEVPERVEEWPEDDTALRKHEWRDSSGRFWQSLGEGDWRFEVGPDAWSFSYPSPYRGPWTRETDA